MKLCSFFLRIFGFVFFIFLTLIFLYGILTQMSNFASIGFFLICLAFAVISLFFNVVFKFIKNLWKKLFGKIFIIFTAFILTICLVCTVVFSFLISSCLADNAPKNTELMIILGCQVKGTEPGYELRNRLNAALAYLEESPDTKIITAGGQGNGEYISEAEAMFNYLTAHGISEDRIFTECDSRSTRENILMSKYVSDENGLGTNVVMVTSDYHQYRAGILAEYYGFKPTHISSKADPIYLPTFWVREFFAVGNDLCRTNFGFSITD